MIILQIIRVTLTKPNLTLPLGINSFPKIDDTNQAFETCLGLANVMYLARCPRQIIKELN